MSRLGLSRPGRRTTIIAKASSQIATGEEDTIVAVVSGEMQGAVSILRLSGSDAIGIAGKVFRQAGCKGSEWNPKSHRVYYGKAVGSDGSTIDEVLAIVMLGPRSYTCEDIVEIHAHGGGVCARRVLTACLEAGATLAKPGEFTLRAFLNGRLDLTQAESVQQLVSAKTASAADSALAGLQGGIGAVVGEHRAECIAILAELEARLDFADEEIPDLEHQELEQRLAKLQRDVDTTSATARVGQLMQAGLQVAIVGRPNVGKSSLLNACSGTDRAIVTDIPGTTRDVVEASISISGVPVRLLDTAGLREATDAVERIGVERSRATATAADIVVMVMDAAQGWTDDDQILWQSLWGDAQTAEDGPKARVTAPSLLVANKTDLTDPRDTQEMVDSISEEVAATFAKSIQTSAADNDGVDRLTAALLELAGAPELAEGSAGWAVNLRQAEALTRATEALANVQQSIRDDMPLDFWTIDLRGAATALGEVNGDEVAEEVLDTVFSKFCIGK